MPRFHFDVIDEGVIQVDEVGLELPDLAAAVEEAQRAIGQMLIEHAPGRNTASLVIQIRDGSSVPLTTVLATTSAIPTGNGNEEIQRSGDQQRHH
jgi:hypothetical protein